MSLEEKAKIKIACILLSLNEEQRIKEALTQFRPYMNYILVLDGGSTDNTVKIAKKIADEVVIKKFSGSFAEDKNYARTLIPKFCGWLLWADADEKWDPVFLKKIREWIIALKGQPGVARVPRVNLPDGKNYPDFQVRVFPNSRDIEWRGKIHEVPWLKIGDASIPLDRADSEESLEKLGGRMSIFNVKDYPIIHLPRRKNVKRKWW